MDPIGEFLRNPIIALCFLLLGAILGWVLEMILFEPFFGQRGRQRENEWRAKFAAADSARGRLEIQLGETRAELDPLRLQMADSEKHLNSLTADLKTGADARARLEAELNALRAQLADREIRISTLSGDLSSGAEARAKLDTELLALRGQLAEREKKVGALTADLNANAEARAKLDADLTEKIGLLAGATALTATLRGDVDSLRNRADAAEVELAAHTTRYTADLGEWKLHAESAEAELGNLRAKLAERINLQHHTEADLAALRADLLAEQQRAGSADAEWAARSVRFDADLGDWRLRAEGAETELANLRAQLADRGNLESDLAKTRLDLTEKAGLLAGAEVLSAQLRGDLDNWRLRAEGAETELVNLRAQLAQSSTRFDAELSGWRLRAEGAETELANLRAQTSERATRFDADLGALRLRADGAETELTAVRSELSDLRVECGQKTEQLGITERELAQLRSDYAAMQSRGAGGALAAGVAGLAAGGLALSGEPGRAEKAERASADLRALLAERVHTLHLTEAELARLRAEVIEARGAAAELEDELAQVIAVPTRAAPRLDVLAAAGEPERDELILINGIGPVFEKRLNEAGILTFAQLAETPDERIVEIVKAKKWQAVDAPFWRRQARDFAAQKLAGAWTVSATQGDELILINGIGPVFERRLKNAGILTFVQLAETPNARILEIVKAKSWQAVDPDFWRRQAREFAAGRPE